MSSSSGQSRASSAHAASTAAAAAAGLLPSAPGPLRAPGRDLAGAVVPAATGSPLPDTDGSAGAVDAAPVAAFLDSGDEEVLEAALEPPQPSPQAVATLLLPHVPMICVAPDVFKPPPVLCDPATPLKPLPAVVRQAAYVWLPSSFPDWRVWLVHALLSSRT